MTSIIESFYKGFQNLDAEQMVACYHEDIVFEDPAFGTLKGNHACNMWRMLCKSQKNKDFKVVFSNITVHEDSGSAHWEAFYTFTKTGRKVHNTVEAQFEFKDGKIIKHVDRFDLYKWSKQAFGFKGTVLGKTLFFKNKLRHTTKNLLTKFEEKQKSSA
ncbi:nuclear transport factor 2 family protein [Sediminibacter sp. Hel_I_10]|uniref:nuclear transport factor 2 family protein n=1 Tax=Sediminibacter sp. Hel_I_10 TaxID=1392490 RepID=UPI00047CD8E8|nr:nuclear transport factor 2 family protein [Sediminibacter sp. Hel_I_10]